MIKKFVWLTVASLFSVLILKAQSTETDSTIQTEPIGYALDIKNNKDFSTFSILDEYIKNKRLIATGEDHSYEEFNTDLELKMFQYLNKNGFNTYVIEGGFASAWWLNKYIEGDSLYVALQQNYYSKHFLKLFDGLREINQSSKTKIKVVGIDIERNTSLILKLMSMLLPDNKPVPDSLSVFAESLKIIAALEEEEIRKGKIARDKEDDDDEDNDYEDDDEVSYNFNFHLVNTVRGIVNDYRLNPKLSKEFLGDNHELFEKLVFELDSWLQWISYEEEYMTQSWAFRELYMERNLRNLMSDTSIKCFGQFGRCHISQIPSMRDCSFAFFSSLLSRLISNKPELKSEMLSIGMFYPNKEQKQELLDNGGIQSFIELTEEGKITLFTETDSTKESQLSQRFDMIIVNKSDTDEDSPKINKTKSQLKKTKEKRKEYTGIAFGTTMFDFSSLESVLGQKTQRIKPHLVLVWGSRLNGGFSATSEVGFWFNQHTDLADTGRISITGFNFKFLFGKDLIPHNKVDFIPYLGFGISNLTLRHREKGQALGLFNNDKELIYQNPGLMLEARIENTYYFGRRNLFHLGYFVGYAYDFSKKHWRTENNLLTRGTETSLSGLYASFCLGFKL